MNLTTDNGDTGTDTGDYYSVSMSNMFGYGTVRFTGYRPDFANDAGTVTFTYDVLADGRVIAHETVTVPAGSDVSTGSWSGYLGSADVTLSIDNVEMVCQYIDVRYVDAAGNNISAHVSEAAPYINGTVPSSLDISLDDDGVYVIGSNYRWSVEGATVTGGNSGTGTVNTADTKAITPTGNDFVTITYSGMTLVDNGYSIVSNLTGDEANAVSPSNSSPAGTALNLLGLSAGMDDVLQICNRSASTSGLSDGQEITFDAQLNQRGTGWDANVYRVVLETTAGDMEFTLTADGTTAITDSDSIRVDGADVEITGLDVYVVTPLLAVESVRRVNGYTVEVTFNQNVCASGPAALSATQVIVAPANSRTATVTHSGTTSDTVTIEFSSNFVNGDQITLDVDAILATLRVGNTLAETAGAGDLVYVYNSATDAFELQ